MSGCSHQPHQRTVGGSSPSLSPGGHGAHVAQQWPEASRDPQQSCRQRRRGQQVAHHACVRSRCWPIASAGDRPMVCGLRGGGGNPEQDIFHHPRRRTRRGESVLMPRSSASPAPNPVRCFTKVRLRKEATRRESVGRARSRSPDPMASPGVSIASSVESSCFDSSPSAVASAAPSSSPTGASYSASGSSHCHSGPASSYSDSSDSTVSIIACLCLPRVRSAKGV